MVIKDPYIQTDNCNVFLLEYNMCKNNKYTKLLPVIISLLADFSKV